MGRAVLQACLPWAAMLVASLAVAYWLVWLNRAPLRLGRLRRIHGDQAGSVQSLSFVLTLPFFVMILMLIVQVSQLMIGTVVVHYAAFAAARSAIVWIPAETAWLEPANCIGSYYADPQAVDQTMPSMNPEADDYGPGSGGMTYLVAAEGPKYEKITSAAVLACMPICPSRDLDLPLSDPATADAATRAYTILATKSSVGPGAIDRLVRNKLAYSAENTEVEIRFFHKNLEPPLATYFLIDNRNEFYFNEIGWQDPITVTVKHRMALLPGPGRLLARDTSRSGGSGEDLSQRIERTNYVYAYLLEASATLGNEGEKSVIPYVHDMQ